MPVAPAPEPDEPQPDLRCLPGTAEEPFGLAEIRSYLQAAGERRRVARQVERQAMQELGNWAAAAYTLRMPVADIAEVSGIAFGTVYKLLRRRQVQMRLQQGSGPWSWPWRNR
jgi:hypothetical protein